MKRIKIFCEGATDQIFIADCIETLYSIKVTRELNRQDKSKCRITFQNGGEIIDVGGCSKLSNDLYIQIMKDNTELGGTNLVVFDADFSSDATGAKTNTGNHGFNSCCQKLNDMKTGRNVHFEYLIWPDHQNDGEIENLLTLLIPSHKKPIIDCIHNHQNCLKGLGINDLKYSQLKDIINHYLYTSFQKPNERERDYKNSNFWNLDFENIIELKKCKIFFDSHFVIT